MESRTTITITTIQGAIDRSMNGDTILVAPGHYLEDIDFLGKTIVLKSEQGPDRTILDGSNEDSSVVIFKRGETRRSTLEGFTITGGRGTLFGGGRSGGGIYCPNGSPLIRSNVITGNKATNGPGGGMFVGTALLADPLPGPLIEDNLFKDNESNGDGNGGGLALQSSRATIRRNVFRDNACPRGDGGGVWAYLFEGEVTIESNQFWENTAYDRGGGLYIADPGPSGGYFVVNRNLFVRNRADGKGTGETGSGGGIAALGVSGSMENNTMVANQGSGETACSGGCALGWDL